MSLFERIQNKRYDLQEKKNKKGGPGYTGRVNPGGNNNKDDFFKFINRSREDYDNLSGKDKQELRKIYDENKLSQRKSKTFKQSFGTPTGADPKTGKPTYKPSYTVDAKGKKKLGPDIDVPKGRGGVPADKSYEKQAKILGDREAAKKTYINPKTNQASKKGIKDYITKARQMRSGSNVPVDSKTTDSIAKISKSEYKNKINQKYGGRRATLHGTKNLKKVNFNFKNFAKKTASKGGKYLKNLPMKNKLGLAALGTVAAIGAFKKFTAPPKDTLTARDFKKSKTPITKSSGEQVRRSLFLSTDQQEKNKEPRISGDRLTRNKNFTQKIKSGEYLHPNLKGSVTKK